MTDDPSTRPKNRRWITRRRFFRLALYGTPALAAADAAWLEPNWLKVRKLNLATGKPSLRFVHFTDLHHKGDREFLESVVRVINAQSPEFVCFTGDLVEEAEHLTETLELLQQIKAPIFGVPGNHDYWSHADFTSIDTAFRRTGGRWLLDESVSVADDINIAGATCSKSPALELKPTGRNIVLIHYPEWVEKLGDYKFDIALAGHSHGGQVRIPFYGPLVVPFGVGRYDLGLFQTPSGPLYVGAGVGWFYLNLRFNCRPEIAVIEI